MSFDVPPPGSPSASNARVLTMQIINGAIVLGAAAVVAVLTLLRSQNPPPPRDPPLLTYIGLAFAVPTLLAALLMPHVVVAGARRRLAGDAAGDSAAWYGIYQTALILRLAFLEGPTLFLAIAWFLEGQAVAVAAALVLIVVMVLQFPSAARVERWAEAQKELAYQGRGPS